HCTPSFRTHFGRPDLPPRLVLTIPRRRLAAPRPAGAGQELRSSYLEGKAAEAPAKIGARARSMARRRQGSARARNRGEECARHFARAREGVRGALRSPGLTVHGEDRSPAGKLHRAVAAVCRSAARLAAEEENQHEDCLPSRKHTKTSGRNRAEICFRCASPPREPATSVEEKSSNVGPNSDVKRLPRS
ncbi:unnamed protein product, partial [Prorocentrum cordatum]